MNTRQRIKIALTLLVSLALSGCGPGQLFGPPLLTDEEFTESARDVCSTLKTNLTAIEMLDLAAEADAYQQAAEELADLEITEESAPQGVRLRSRLTDVVTSLDAFAEALPEALAKAGVTGAYTLFITENGSVFVTSGDILSSSLAQLEIEAVIILELNEAKALVREAATSLELEECVIEK